MWNELQISTSEGIRFNSLMFPQKKKKKKILAGILSSLTAGLCISLMQFQERRLLGKGGRIPFCMQISVLNWRSYSPMMLGQQQQYLAIPFTVVIRWPWDLPNWSSTVSINIPFSRIVFSAISETILVKNQFSWAYLPFTLTLPLHPSPPLIWVVKKASEISLSALTFWAI